MRIGNGAYKQLQLDIYGELMDSVYLYNKYGPPISYDLWIYLRRLTNWVCEHWKEKDEAIWEVRGGPQQFTYSKLMCWVAVDRGAPAGRQAVVSRGPAALAVDARRDLRDDHAQRLERAAQAPSSRHSTAMRWTHRP